MIPVHTGNLEDAARTIQPVKEFGPPILDMLGPIPYQAQQCLLDGGFAPGQNVYWKSTFLTDLSPEAIEVIVRKAEEMPVPTCNLVLEHFHGAVRRVPRDATAFQERDAAYNIAIVGVWQDPKDEAACVAWARGVYDDLQPFSTGSVYVNYLGVGDEEERVQDAYGDNFARLAQIKQKYDPENLFRVNQNIKPRA
jgi:FAD/FMN-containing dehydrogenase